MSPSPAAATSGSAPKRGGKRRRGRSASGSRPRKKQKRLDAIRDPPTAANAACPLSPEDPSLRRSSRVRRAPNVLDSSPVPSSRRSKKSRLGEPKTPTGDGGNRRIAKNPRGLGDGSGRKEAKLQDLREKEAPGNPASEIKNSELETEDWELRLRSRVGGRKVYRVGKEKVKVRLFASSDQVRPVDRAVKKEEVSAKSDAISKPVKLSGSHSFKYKRKGKIKKMVSVDKVSETADDMGDCTLVQSSNAQEDSVQDVSGKMEALKDVSETHVDSRPILVSDSEVAPVATSGLVGSPQLEEAVEEAGYANASQGEKLDRPLDEGNVIHEQESKDSGCGDHADIPSYEQKSKESCHGNHAEIPSSEHPNDKVAKSMEILKEDYHMPTVADDKTATKHIKEGRRCALCGGGSDGKPPKRLVQEPSGSDHDAYVGSSASEEPNYDVWDGFGDEPGWLGRLLGPIRDRYGIARVWVHQHCAVWSPEVYFAGLGCLKNVRAALYRGRALKCSRCGRPGATIGCRVERCPKTYHLPCSRAEGCIFDHRKFLIACNDHRHLFQPQGDDYSKLIKKLKAKKLKFDMRKVSHDAWRKDLESEEKWLENCGEDEEFLKREGKRLHRDLLRIAPEYIGGSSENEKSYQGWESVAGLQNVINCMKEVVILPLLYPEVFESLGLTPPRGVLLHGYPGTGKTLVVRALIGACSRGNRRIAYFARKGADCLGKYVGDAERQLRLLFQVAERSQPSIIFFDEIDGLAPCRSRNQDQTHNSVVSTLLSLLDGLKSRGSVIVIGATNRPDAIDPALRRPGRFDREIYFPLPMLKDRSDILSLHTKGWPNPLSRSLLSWIANQTAGYAGADLQALCTQAAMNALKRNCPLQELLSSAAEMYSTDGIHPPLPSFIVEERDWLAALAVAPPPCSRRAAGMAANDIISSPLSSHLIPCLLKSLSELLVSFHIDERIWLSPPLFKASKSIKNVIFSALEQKNLPAKVWQLHLHSLIQQPCIAKEIVRILSSYGLVIGDQGYLHPNVFDNVMNDLESCDSYGLKTSNIGIKSTSRQKLVNLGHAGFRALISGTPRSGQQHLASCLIHGFTGHIEIQKLNLATMLQEGNGDLIHGLTQFLLKCLNMQRCIIYMPRMDLWAIDHALREDVKLNQSSPESCSDSCQELIDIENKASEAWTLFVEQVYSMSASSSVTILATCEIQICDLPLGIKQFFTNSVPDDGSALAAPEHIIPCFHIDIDGRFNSDSLVNSFGTKLSMDLVQQFIQLIHHKSHTGMHVDKQKAFDSLRVISGYKTDHLHQREANILVEKSEVLKPTLSKYGASSDVHQNHLDIDDDKRGSLPDVKTNGVFGIHHHGQEDLLARNFQNIISKGDSILAIATLGYQLLRSPQFAELCWVTSKLKEGPCTDTSGPWKGWPFNSCITRPIASPEKIASGATTNHRDRENSGVVRGLVAVGLLAYRGKYASVREVSFEVRRVVELLVEQVRAKIAGGRDRYRYLRILSQVAYLEDMVNSWAYTLRSLPEEPHKGVSSAKPTIGEAVHVGDELDGNAVHNHSNKLNHPETTYNGNQDTATEGSPHKSITDNEDSLNVYKISSVLSPLSDVRLRMDIEHASSDTLLFDSCISSSVATSAVPTGDGNFIRQRLQLKDDFNGPERAESTLPPKGINCNTDSLVEETDSCFQLINNQDVVSESVPSPGDVVLSNHQPVTATGSAQEETNDFLVASDTSCLYHCCIGCLYNVHVMVENILRDNWKSKGSHSKLDDIHDNFASCSLNLTSAIRDYYARNCSHHKDYVGKEHEPKVHSSHCACKEFLSKQLDTNSSQLIPRKTSFLPKECSCHSETMDNTAMENSDLYLLLGSDRSFFFKNGVQMPLNPHVDTVFHCKFENLCVCSIIEIIAMNRQSGH